MENNEDNRQMTALQEHLRYLNGIRSEFVGYPGAEPVIATLDRSIQNAESLLTKEREFANKMFQAGINNVMPHSHTWDDENYQYEYYTIEEKEFEQVFNETYTQDYKTK